MEDPCVSEPTMATEKVVQNCAFCADLKLQNERLAQLCATQVKELEMQRKQIIEKNSMLDQVHQMSAVLKEVVRNSDAELSTIKSQLHEKESALFELRKSKARVTLDYERTDDELRRSRCDLSSIAHEMMLQSESITDTKRELAYLKHSEREMTENLRTAENQNEQLVSELKDVTSKLGIAQTDLTSAVQLNGDLSTRLSNAEQKNATVDQQLSELIIQHHTMCQAKSSLEDQLEVEKAENHHHRYELKTLKCRHQWLSDQLFVLSELIKTRLQSRESFCFKKFPFLGRRKRVYHPKSLAYLDDKSYGLVQELVSEFPQLSTVVDQ